MKAFKSDNRNWHAYNKTTRCGNLTDLSAMRRHHGITSSTVEYLRNVNGSDTETA
jgi:hypothetical protein